jgi:ABC-type multidrug transport system ATPase subunit
MMRTICGILEQSYGKIWINGIDTQEKREELQGLIGYLPQEFGMYENMAAWDYLDYQAILKGITDKETREQRLEYVLKQFTCTKSGADKIWSIRRYEKRIGIRRFVTPPKIQVVDERLPASPARAHRFRHLLGRADVANAFVIYSKHFIEVISSSCNQWLIIATGKIHRAPSKMVQWPKSGLAV